MSNDVVTGMTKEQTDETHEVIRWDIVTNRRRWLIGVGWHIDNSKMPQVTSVEFHFGPVGLHLRVLHFTKSALGD